MVLQDTKLANAAAWNNLAAANEEQDGQKGAEEEEEIGDPMWNTFQSRDDIEREKASTMTAIHASLIGQQVSLSAFVVMFQNSGRLGSYFCPVYSNDSPCPPPPTRMLGFGNMLEVTPPQAQSELRICSTVSIFSEHTVLLASCIHIPLLASDSYPYVLLCCTPLCTASQSCPMPNRHEAIFIDQACSLWRCHWRCHCSIAVISIKPGNAWSSRAGIPNVHLCLPL